MVTDISIHPRPEDSKDVPSFEGNQGIQAVSAGMAEMLLQSHDGAIRLLPALPKLWAAGNVKGLRARGGFVVDMAWENNALTSVNVRSRQGKVCKLIYRDKTVTVQTRVGADYTSNGDLNVNAVR